MSRIWRTWSVLLLFAIGTSLITPLIPIYQERLGFGDTVVTLFLGCYVVGLVPSMLSMGQVSDRIGRKAVLLGALATLATAQALLVTEPGLAGVLAARGIQGVATGAFFGTCTAFLVDAAPAGRRMFASVLGSISVRLGLGLGPGVGGVLAQYAGAPLRLPFQLHLIALALATAIVLTLPETVTERSRRPLSLRLEVPTAERAVFWRVLVPSGMLFSLFDGVALSLIPVFLVRELEVDNFAVVGAAGFLVLVSGALSQIALARMRPSLAIGVGLVWATVASVGVVASAPIGSVALALVAVAATGAGAGLVFQGGIDLCTQIAPPADRGKLLSAYYVACYLGGFSVPLLLVGVLGDLIGLTPALACLSGAAAAGAALTILTGLRALHALVPDPHPIEDPGRAG
ncbi:MAG: MFS transporter [Miltoncostaeaceae bacterium]